jgi:hypothetical protein
MWGFDRHRQALAPISFAFSHFRALEGARGSHESARFYDSCMSSSDFEQCWQSPRARSMVIIIQQRHATSARPPTSSGWFCEPRDADQHRKEQILYVTKRVVKSGINKHKIFTKCRAGHFSYKTYWIILSRSCKLDLVPMVNITLPIHQLHGEFIPILQRIYVL